METELQEWGREDHARYLCACPNTCRLPKYAADNAAEHLDANRPSPRCTFSLDCEKSYAGDNPDMWIVLQHVTPGLLHRSLHQVRWQRPLPNRFDSISDLGCLSCPQDDCIFVIQRRVVHDPANSDIVWRQIFCFLRCDEVMHGSLGGFLSKIRWVTFPNGFISSARVSACSLLTSFRSGTQLPEIYSGQERLMEENMLHLAEGGKRVWGRTEIRQNAIRDHEEQEATWISSLW